MNNFSISQYFLLNSNEGYIKIIEFNNQENIIFLWGLTKEFNFCDECPKHKLFMKCSEIEDCPEAKKTAEKSIFPEYIQTGDSKLISGYFASVNQFAEKLSKIYPNNKIIPLGMFRNIIECRSYLSEMRATLNGQAIRKE